MKVLLLRGIKKLGVAGEIKEVANGYARNFLIPRGWVKIATDNVVSEFKMRDRTKEIRKMKIKKEQSRTAHDLGGVCIEVPMKIVGNSHGCSIYGSVTSQIISQALRKSGYNVSNKQIIIPKTIKSLGEHSVNVKLDGVKPSVLKVNVVEMES